MKSEMTRMIPVRKIKLTRMIPDRKLKQTRAARLVVAPLDWRYIFK